MISVSPIRLTNSARLTAVGYCFGGTGVLELARTGADLLGVVSFHGGPLSSPTPEDGKKIKARVLVLHGADDPNVPPSEVAAFEKEMREARVDWQLVAYGNAVHSFTQWHVPVGGAQALQRVHRGAQTQQQPQARCRQDRAEDEERRPAHALSFDHRQQRFGVRQGLRTPVHVQG